MQVFCVECCLISFVKASCSRVSRSFLMNARVMGAVFFATDVELSTSSPVVGAGVEMRLLSGVDLNQ